jgi:hypothetical protein
MSAWWVSSNARWRAGAGIALAATAVLILPACESLGLNKGTSSREGPTASAVRHPTIQDIPIPNGFMLVDDHSVGHSSGNLRVVRFEFVGGMERAPVNRFYKEYMNAAGWTLKKETFDRGIYDMYFENDTEECLIRLRPEKKKTVIVVDIGPLPRGSAEREARPPVPPP